MTFIRAFSRTYYFLYIKKQENRVTSMHGCVRIPKLALLVNICNLKYFNIVDICTSYNVLLLSICIGILIYFSTIKHILETILF